MIVRKRNFAPVYLGSLVIGFLLLLFASTAGAQTLPGSYATSWIGNSFAGYPNTVHVQDDIEAMYVASNGNCFTDSYWDEGGSEAGFYLNGAVAGNCGDNHGWGRGGGQAVTSDGAYVYVAIIQGAGAGYTGGTNSNGLPSYPSSTSTYWYCLRRFVLCWSAVC